MIVLMSTLYAKSWHELTEKFTDQFEENSN